MRYLTLPKVIQFDWDKGNIDKNEIKHQVSAKECEKIFTDNPVFAADPTHSQNEDRWSVVGETTSSRQMFLVFTIRNNKVRIISARDVDKKERSKYAEKIKENT